MDFLTLQLTIPNIIWIGISTLLVAAYVSTYLLESQNKAGGVLRYMVEFGKLNSLSIASKGGIPKKLVNV